MLNLVELLEKYEMRLGSLLQVRLTDLHLSQDVNNFSHILFTANGLNCSVGIQWNTDFTTVP